MRGQSARFAAFALIRSAAAPPWRCASAVCSPGDWFFVGEAGVLVRACEPGRRGLDSVSSRTIWYPDQGTGIAAPQKATPPARRRAEGGLGFLAPFTVARRTDVHTDEFREICPEAHVALFVPGIHLSLHANKRVT
jgi:hypothetical protein